MPRRPHVLGPTHTERRGLDRSVLEKLKKGVCHWKTDDDEVDMLKEFERAGEGAEEYGSEADTEDGDQEAVRR